MSDFTEKHFCCLSFLFWLQSGNRKSATLCFMKYGIGINLNTSWLVYMLHWPGIERNKIQAPSALTFVIGIICKMISFILQFWLWTLHASWGLSCLQKFLKMKRKIQHRLFLQTRVFPGLSFTNNVANILNDSFPLSKGSTTGERAKPLHLSK